ncbi:MAG: TonB-dependent receptor plug domain-containing protein [Pontibacterium sp.]
MLDAIRFPGLPVSRQRHYLVLSFIVLGLSSPGAVASDVDQLIDLPLQALLDMEVTSVSRREQNLLTAPAAIHVVTSEDLRRRGVTSIPDALRMVPGLHVASIDGNKWTVSSRGFSMRYANKLLVQIDGRSVYTPTYSGVYWDMQDVLISDIDRIEVIRGPGATLWGANAVNGVINIITKSAVDTVGVQVEAGAGNQLQRMASFRYGAQLSENLYGRFYGKQRKYNSNDLLFGGGDAYDSWDASSVGFRLDAEVDDTDSWTLQGDVFDNNENQTLSVLLQPAPVFVEQAVKDDYESQGWNLLGRWTHSYQDQSSSQLQLYWDHAERDERYLGQNLDTLDLDLQHQLAPVGRQSFIWGLGYRRIDASYRNSFAVSILPDSQHLNLYSAFIQDQIALSPDELTLTLGSKFEHNDFTGWEVQPSVRLMWMPGTGHSLWSSVSKAVRTPSIVEYSGRVAITTLPSTVFWNADGGLKAEKMTAYEVGYRYNGNRQYSLDAALFYNDYDQYLSFEPVSMTDIIGRNQIYGRSYGLELSAVWQAAAWWQLKAGYSYVNIRMENRNDSRDVKSANVTEASSPENTLTLHSAMELGGNWELDAWLSYVDEVPEPSLVPVIDGLDVDSYISANARVAWQVRPDLELSITANNLFDDQHLEYIGEYFSTPTEIRRSIFAQIRWNF